MNVICCCVLQLLLLPDARTWVLRKACWCECWSWKWFGGFNFGFRWVNCGDRIRSD